MSQLFVANKISCHRRVGSTLTPLTTKYIGVIYTILQLSICGYIQKKAWVILLNYQNHLVFIVVAIFFLRQFSYLEKSTLPLGNSPHWMQSHTEIFSQCILDGVYVVFRIGKLCVDYILCFKTVVIAVCNCILHHKVKHSIPFICQYQKEKSH